MPSSATWSALRSTTPAMISLLGDLVGVALDNARDDLPNFVVVDATEPSFLDSILGCQLGLVGEYGQYVVDSLLRQLVVGNEIEDSEEVGVGDVFHWYVITPEFGNRTLQH